MSLINCPECDNQISDKSSTCIKCGYPLSKYKNITCPECNTSISYKINVCTHCGYPLNSNKDRSSYDKTTSISKIPLEVSWNTGTMTLLILGTMAIPILGTGFGIYGVTKESKKTQGIILLVFSVVMWVINYFIVLFITSLFN
jgi:uncharacterized paraquat-inducible protein A